MELMNWIWAAVALGSGLLIGELAGRLTRSALSRPSSRPLVIESPRTAGNVVFWSAVLVGLVVAAGLLNPDTLNEFGESLSHKVPSILLAGAWMIAGYAASVAVAAMVGESALKATGVRQVALERALRTTIMAAAIAAALNQAGVHSGIVLVIVAIGVATPALTVALLTAFGGRQVASQLAAGRVLRAHLHEGDHISTLGHHGRVAGLCATTVAIEVEGGSVVHLPNSQLVEMGFEVRPGARSTTG
ncbi:MAG: hypothetical protein V9F03_03040 [Microthrixaceae bacterium]